MKSLLLATLIVCLLPPLVAIGADSRSSAEEDQAVMRDSSARRGQVERVMTDKKNESGSETSELKEASRPSDEVWSKQHWDRVGDMTK